MEAWSHSEAGLQGYQNAPGDDFDWTRQAGRTSSFNTGPAMTTLWATRTVRSGREKEREGSEGRKTHVGKQKEESLWGMKSAYHAQRRNGHNTALDTFFAVTGLAVAVTYRLTV